MTSHDAATLAWYDAQASTYANRGGKRSPHAALVRFMSELPAGARVLELGTGGGQDAEAMIGAGFDVAPTDGSAGLAKEAEARLGRPVRLMRFDELEEVAAYDAVWASACLLHAPEEALPDILTRIRRALRPGGLFYASFKAGTGGDRDELGRYYNFPTLETLDAAYAASGLWASREVQTHEGGGYDGVARTWIHVLARRG